ncbi:MAG: hypothetical protein JXB47_12040 [Anaerolineae bacterium]|nr:hypothetical protein [Anaerolineae bacterium]
MIEEVDLKHLKPTGGVLAEVLEEQLDDKLIEMEPASPEALKAAFDLVGDEIARREALANRKGDTLLVERLMAGLRGLFFAASSIDDGVLINDFLRDAEDLCEALAGLPPSDPDDDDAWVAKGG